MPRVKGAKHSLKRRRNILKRTKGFKWGRSKKERLAREALMHAGEYAFDHRKDKKGDFRRLWQTRISAALKPYEHSYSKFMGELKNQGIELNRKVLSDLAKNKPEVFDRVVKKVSGKT